MSEHSTIEWTDTTPTMPPGAFVPSHAVTAAATAICTHTVTMENGRVLIDGHDPCSPSAAQRWPR
jgi:hypothetical protein